jgi:hypothetical protein
MFGKVHVAEIGGLFHQTMTPLMAIEEKNPVGLQCPKAGIVDYIAPRGQAINRVVLIQLLVMQDALLANLPSR